MRVGLFGQFGGGNLGSDGSLEAMLLTLLRKAPDAELVCLCPNPKAIESRFDISSVPTGLCFKNVWPAPLASRLRQALFGRAQTYPA